MHFDRVRTDEQRKIRIGQIKDAAIKLFDERSYHEITLADIAKETHFTRGNLYKYVASKEEIFLLVIIDEITAWVSDIQLAFQGKCVNDIDCFASLWAQITYKHKRFLKLFAILMTVLEKNVSLENLVAFKNEFAALLPLAYAAIGDAFPAWDQAAIGKFIELQKNYAVGLFPSTSPTPMQLEATQCSRLEYQFPDFVESFTEFIRYTLQYIDSDFKSHL